MWPCAIFSFPLGCLYFSTLSNPQPHTRLSPSPLSGADKHRSGPVRLYVHVREAHLKASPLQLNNAIRGLIHYLYYLLSQVPKLRMSPHLPSKSETVS